LIYCNSKKGFCVEESGERYASGGDFFIVQSFGTVSKLIYVFMLLERKITGVLKNWKEISKSSTQY